MSWHARTDVRLVAPVDAAVLGGENDHGPAGLDCGGAGVSRPTVQPLDKTNSHTDLDGDGCIDHDDIAIFEQPHSIPHDLSTALRAAQAR